ncbi:flavin-dependent dehydrogenase [Streptomyces sp. KhCrAH-43]|nr:FAD-dependent oxidoreductase [Streptomyces sp. KhCrAH-43]MYS39170.1 NAD-binding protein [Streptomyces sp. SID4920]MYX64215.1 NAD-binding protein [Streptomyces sp. SID8373]RAJ48727.1 flavin-dependent dehydrogenase [Streptomyces sp. KhCrAH-43]
MADIVVLGAGVAGLGLAAFAARRGHRVTLVERDGPPPEGGADAEVADWERRGVPHARQGHALLGLGISVLRQECPGVLDELTGRGAVAVPLETGGDDLGLLSRRLVFEAALRRRALAGPGVTLLRDRATGLLAAGAPHGCPHVHGVRLAEGGDLAADVVLDATGRRSAVAAWLTALGGAPPRETVQSCGFSYIAQEFALDPGGRFPSLRAPVVHELDFATVLAFPGDNGRFHLSTTVSSHDPLRTRLLDRPVYLRFLASVDGARDWLDRATPVREPMPMAGLENRRRSLVADGAPLVTGYALVGDACVQTNPTFGRGVSLALAHARAVADRLDRLDQDPHRWAVETHEATEECLGLWFEQQVATDAARLAELAGGGHDDSLAARVLTALAVLREEDEQVRVAAERVYHMLLTPAALMTDRKVARRVLAFLREHPDLRREHVGPNRRDFERLVTG